MCLHVFVCVHPPCSALSNKVWDEDPPLGRHYSIPPLQCLTVCVCVCLLHQQYFTPRRGDSLYTPCSFTHIYCPLPHITPAHTEHAVNHLLTASSRLVHTWHPHSTFQGHQGVKGLFVMLSKPTTTLLTNTTVSAADRILLLVSSQSSASLLASDSKNEKPQ